MGRDAEGCGEVGYGFWKGVEKWNRDVGEVLRVGIGILDGCRACRGRFCRRAGRGVRGKSKGGCVM